MPNPNRRCAAALATVFAAALSYGSQAVAEPVLTPISIEAFAYERLDNWGHRQMRPAGFAEVTEEPGSVFLDIRGVFDVPWSDALGRIAAQSNKIHVVLPDGTQVEPFGAFDYFGQMHLNPNSISLQKPREFPDKDADLYYHSLWKIPAGTQTVTLRIPSEASFEGEVAVPPVSEAADAASFADFRVDAVRRFRAARTEQRRAGSDFKGTITAPEGQVMAGVTLTIAGKAANNFAADPKFYWRTHSFRLVDADGNTLGLIGERFMKNILGWQFSSVDVGKSAARTMIWAVPEDLASATLLFGETPVAEIPLAGSVAVTDVDG